MKSLKFNAFSHRVQRQPPPQTLRFSHGTGERETRVTGDEPLLPAFLCAYIFIERETSGYEAGPEEFRVNKSITYLKSHLEKYLYLSLSTTN